MHRKLSGIVISLFATSMLGTSTQSSVHHGVIYNLLCWSYCIPLFTGRGIKYSVQFYLIYLHEQEGWSLTQDIGSVSRCSSYKPPLTDRPPLYLDLLCVSVRCIWCEVGVKVFLCNFLLDFLRPGLFMELGVCWLGWMCWPVSFRDLPFSASPALGY